MPAARSKKVAAGVKVSCVVSAIADSPKSARIYPERTAEAKILRLRPWLKGCILLLELGYFKYLFFDRIARYGDYFVSRLIFKELRSHYRMDQIPSANPETVKCLIWIAILALMCSRRILRLIRNANPENADRYTHLRWAKIFTEQADRLLTEVLECVWLKLDMLTLYNIYLS